MRLCYGVDLLYVINTCIRTEEDLKCSFTSYVVRELLWGGEREGIIICKEAFLLVLTRV